MPILDLQQRQRELGRIRIGDKKPTERGGLRPAKLEAFRFTSASQEQIAAIADLYGGQAKPWSNDGASEFEVYTTATSVPILVPPQPISQWYEMWSGGGCQRRCDGRTNVLDDSPCACPSDPLERSDLAAKGRACKATTRLNVVLQDVPGIGYWRLESHGYHSAVELPMVAEFLAQATEAGAYIPASLVLAKRSSKRPGQGKREWMVPAIDIASTPRELMAGGAGARAAVTASGRAALESGRPDYAKRAQAATTIEQWREVWNDAAKAGHLDADLKDLLGPIGRRLSQGEQSTAPSSPGADAEPVDAEFVDEDAADQVWAQVVECAGELGWDIPAVQEQFARRNPGVSMQSASLAALEDFLTWIKGGAVAA